MLSAWCSVLEVGDALGLPEDLLADEDGNLNDGGEENGNKEGREDSAKGEKDHHKGRELEIILPVVNDEHGSHEVRGVERDAEFGEQVAEPALEQPFERAAVAEQRWHYGHGREQGDHCVQRSEEEDVPGLQAIFFEAVEDHENGGEGGKAGQRHPHPADPALQMPDHPELLLLPHLLELVEQDSQIVADYEASAACDWQDVDPRVLHVEEVVR